MDSFLLIVNQGSNLGTLTESLLEKIAEQGLSILPELIRIANNTEMKAKLEQYLGTPLRAKGYPCTLDDDDCDGRERIMGGRIYLRLDEPHR